MCGIFAVLSGESTTRAPTGDQLVSLAEVAATASTDPLRLAGFTVCVEHLELLEHALGLASAVEVLVGDPSVAERISRSLDVVAGSLAELESELDSGAAGIESDVEELNSAIVAVRDLSWSIQKDRLRNAAAVAVMAGPRPGSAAVSSYLSIQLALSAIDRLEVRGRDSAGISVVVRNAAIDETFRAQATKRHDRLLRNNSIELAEDVVAFVYKAAAEIGALGDNISAIRAAIESDELLRQLLGQPDARVTVMSHTRWASVGTVSVPNAHPVDSQMATSSPGPYVLASLNGDVDNFMALRREHNLATAEEITTDAKVIPTLVSQALATQHSALDAFRSVVVTFEGSVAIECVTASSPDRLLLAVRGSGQGCYVGLADGAFVVASEPYGLIETCNTYFRIDGETPSPQSGLNGQVVELRTEGAGTLEGVKRLSYGGEELPVSSRELVTPEITTRDIDRGPSPHFLLKEIGEAPVSVQRTLRGKISGAAGRLSVELSDDVIPPTVRAGLKSGSIDRIVAIGQGTAAIASQALAAMMAHVGSDLPVVTTVATELSGFGLRDDMSGVLVVAVSQSGTTTDTNRTVDLARGRGASVIAIVNRRESDLTEKADGVLYTSDGRDVEMSVASTKAFYAQVVAATLLGLAIADIAESLDRRAMHELLVGLRKLPGAMNQVLDLRPRIADAANKFAPSRRSWALVGSGNNIIAARELRIKLSELCYKSIACDVTEDKKHIDLSSEPLILVCAAGLVGSNAQDVSKEVAIYKAHKACPIVVATAGSGFDGEAVIEVPAVHPAIDFVLSAMVGHIFGYEAALAIDAQGRVLRALRATVDDVIAKAGEDEDVVFAHLRHVLSQSGTEALKILRSGAMDGHLHSSTAVRLATLLRAGMGLLHLDALEVELGRSVSPVSMMHELVAALSVGIDELTRPVDAVKHQAKTVTVGISRAEESYAEIRLVKEAVAAGAPRARLSYRSMRLLSALESAVAEVVGFTRYRVDGDIANGEATVEITGRGGVAQGLESRADRDPRLIGTKHRAAYERVVTVGRGERDGRSVVIIPETKGQLVTAILLLHVKFHARLDADVARQVLTGYRGRYAALVDAVTETEPEFDDSKLAGLGLLDLLVEPVRVLADNWRT